MMDWRLWGLLLGFGLSLWSLVGFVLWLLRERKREVVPRQPSPREIELAAQVEHWKGRAVAQTQRVSELEAALVHARAQPGATTTAPAKDHVDRVARAQHLAEIMGSENAKGQRVKFAQLKGHFRDFKEATGWLLRAIVDDRPREQLLGLVDTLTSLHGAPIATHYELEQSGFCESGAKALERIPLHVEPD